MRDPAPLITEAHDHVRELYGDAIGRDRHDVVTPALVVDLDILKANLAYMQSRLPGLHARLRGHVKNHKSPHIARLQLSTARSASARRRSGRPSSWSRPVPTTC
jgi:hypothetical protein